LKKNDNERDAYREKKAAAKRVKLLEMDVNERDVYREQKAAAERLRLLEMEDNKRDVYREQKAAAERLRLMEMDDDERDAFRENKTASPCCDAEGECSKHFPYDLQSKTQMTGEGYPNYRRRGVHEGGHVYKYQKSKNVDPIILDNGWVVPYNPFLLKLFEAHINVEICSTVKAVKYLHKYVFKGSDKAQIEVVRTNHTGLQT